jgi:hypothetical protein
MTDYLSYLVLYLVAGDIVVALMLHALNLISRRLPRRVDGRAICGGMLRPYDWVCRGAVPPSSDLRSPRKTFSRRSEASAVARDANVR